MKLHDFHVLVVDDNESDRLIVKAILKGFKVHDITEAENGAIAHSKIEVKLNMLGTFNLFIIDWNMPHRNGLNTIKYIRSIPQLDKAKIIVMTASSDRETVDEAIRMGANDFIVKPIQPATLVQKLEKL